MALRSSGFSCGMPCLSRAFLSISVRLLYGTQFWQQAPIYFIDSLVITLQVDQQILAIIIPLGCKYHQLVPLGCHAVSKARANPFFEDWLQTRWVVWVRCVWGEFGIVYKRIMLKQPDTKVRMTNVATIRYKINNKNFEIACYRNKAVNWRNGLEEDLSEVLQIEEIYENASHGVLAKKADLNKFFASKTKREIIEIILERGELQVSDKEREAQTGNILADIVKIIVEKCVHPATKRRFTPENIKLAIKQVHFPLKLDQPAKKQALDCIKLLQKRYKIARGEMKIRLTFEQDIRAQLEERLQEVEVDEVEKEEVKGSQLVRTYNIEPNKYREINQVCKKLDKVVVEVLVGVIVNEENKGLETEQFSALELLDELKEKEEQPEEEVKPEKPKKELGQKEEKAIKCTNCGETAVFATAQDQRQHFKSEWHVENVKRKSKGLPALSEEEHKIESFNKDFK